MLEAKESLFKEFLVEHTKDKIKGDIEDSLYDVLKKFLMSHLYSAIISVSFVVVGAAAIAAPKPDAHIEKVEEAPAAVLAIQGEVEELLPEESESESAETEEQETEAAYVLTDMDKEGIHLCVEPMVADIIYNVAVGGYVGFYDFMWSEELEAEVGMEYYLDLYDDVRGGDVITGVHVNSHVCHLDQDSWTTTPATVIGQELADRDYPVAEVYTDVEFYGTYTAMVGSEEGQIGAARYLVTLVQEDGAWCVVSMINVSHYLDERGDAFL